MLVGSGVPVLVKGVLEVPHSVKVTEPTGRLWAFEGSPPVGVLEALKGSLPEGVSAGGLEVDESSPSEKVLEVLRGSLPQGVTAVLPAKWMNMSEEMIATSYISTDNCKCCVLVGYLFITSVNVHALSIVI